MESHGTGKRLSGAELLPTLSQSPGWTELGIIAIPHLVLIYIGYQEMEECSHRAGWSERTAT